MENKGRCGVRREFLGGENFVSLIVMLNFSVALSEGRGCCWPSAHPQLAVSSSVPWDPKFSGESSWSVLPSSIRVTSGPGTGSPGNDADFTYDTDSPSPEVIKAKEDKELDG